MSRALWNNVSDGNTCGSVTPEQWLSNSGLLAQTGPEYSKTIRGYEQGVRIPSIDILDLFVTFFKTDADFILYGKNHMDDGKLDLSQKALVKSLSMALYMSVCDETTPQMVQPVPRQRPYEMENQVVELTHEQEVHSLFFIIMKERGF